MSRQYYVSRPGPSVASLGESYWRQKPDPDGRVRDMTSRRERRKKLKAMREELDWLALERWRRAFPGQQDHAPTGVDVGCGVGWTLQAMQAHGWHAEGVEPDQWAAKQASPFARGAVIYLDVALLRPCRYDAALCYHVIEHVPEPIPFLRQVLQALKPGALMVIGTPDFDSPGARRFGKRFRLLSDPTHVSLFTTRSLCALLEDHGCRIERVHFPDPPKLRGKQTRRVSPPQPGNIVTVFARRGSPKDEAEANVQREAWERRESSDLLGCAPSLV